MNRFSPPPRAGASSRADTSAAAPDSPAAPVFSPGDTVMHPSEGLCTIQAVSAMRFGDHGARPYYILKPSMETSSSTVYMPVDRGNATLRRLLGRADIDRLILESASLSSLWIEDNKQRHSAFTTLLSKNDYPRLIRMIGEIDEHSERRLAEGKKPCASDEAIRQEAQSLLHQEFAYVLHLSEQDMAAYIRKKIKGAARPTA